MGMHHFFFVGYLLCYFTVTRYSAFLDIEKTLSNTTGIEMKEG